MSYWDRERGRGGRGGPENPKIIVSDQEDFQFAMSFSTTLKLYHMCGLRGGIRKRSGTISLWETEQLILSMGPEWREVWTLALKVTTPSKRFCIWTTMLITVHSTILYNCARSCESQVRDVVLMNVYLDLGNSGGSGFWNRGYMSQGREMGS